MGNVNSRVLVELTLDEMKKCVAEGSFVILPRDKNLAFIEDCNISTQEQTDILLALTIEDYSESEPSERVVGSYVNKFGKQVELKKVLDKTAKPIDMYVKFEIVENSNGNRTVFISFHEEEYKLSFPFRQ